MSDPFYDDAGPDVGVGVSTGQMDIARAIAEAKAKEEAEAKAKEEAEAKAEKQRLDALAAEEEAEQRAQAEEQKRAPTKSYSDIGVTSAELDRQAVHRELIDRLEEKMASGRERVALAKGENLPDSDVFVGIPGPASRPREGSIREKIQEPISDFLQKIEEDAVRFRTGMELAGRELGAEAQEAYREEDYLEALVKGTVAATTRAGTGIYDAASFMVRPLAWGKTAEALVKGAKDVIEHPEEVPSGITKWAENVARDPGSIVQFGASIYTGHVAGRVVGEAYRSWKIRKLSEFYSEFPEEAFYIEDGIPDPRIPHPTDVERLVVKSKEQVRIVDDLGAGFLDEHKIATGSWPKSGTKGFGLRRTGHDLIPELIPEGMGRLETVYRFGLEYGQTHLPGVTGLPPYFEAALGARTNIFPSIGGATGLLSGITPDIYDPLGIEKLDSIQKSTPTLDDTGLGELPKIIEMVDETYKQKPDPKPPKIVPRPPKTIQDPWIEPGYVEKPDWEVIEDTDITTITIQDIFQEQKPNQEPIQDQPPYVPPFITQFLEGSPQTPPRPKRRYKEPDEKLIDEALFPDIFGLKKKTSRIATPQESFMSMLFGGPSKKKKRKKKRKKKS